MLLDLVEVMVLSFRASSWMSDGEVSELLALLRAQDYSDAGSHARLALCIAQLHAHRAEWPLAAQACAEGLGLESSLPSEEQQWGVAPMLTVLSAHVHLATSDFSAAAAAVERLHSYGSSYSQYRAASFKVAQVQKKLGIAVASLFTPLYLRAGRCGETLSRRQHRPRQERPRQRMPP